ncbi:MAG: carboxypeptidase-like regulatory domain-containing protein, partial [Candidatus Staskawiczbacteria bacterium]|nr:carboxypeptidase-like regulatory domain-containing protein [Candidatus Staskawiczbacteria bacterium]
VSINNGAASTKTRDVVLALTAGSNVARMSISNDLSFVNAMQEPYSATKAWTLTDGQGQKTVYVKFFTQYGVASNIVSASINYSTTIGIAEQILDQVAAIRRQIAELFGPQTQQISYPPISESVTQTTPQALQGLQIMSVNPLSKFNLSPVNSSISFFADKLSQLQKTLDTLSVDVSKVQDVKKLSQTELQLQGLTKTILTQEQILQANQLANANQPASAEGLQANTLAQIQGVPLAQLSAEAISKMPSDMVFARTPGGLIDFGSVLSVNANGTAEQKITVVSGKPIELVIKPDQPASRVTGLITSKNLQNAENTLPTQDVVARFFSAALAAATPAPVAQNSSSAGLLVQKFEYAEAKPGVFKAEINAPTTKGEYQIITIIEYEDPSLLPAENSITAVVDPEGYVYSQTSNGKLRIENAAVSIYWLNPDTKEYQLWPADKFFQKNPVVTDDTGRYSFLVPQGTYYLTATAPNYYDFKSDSFSIAGDNGITMNVGLKKKGFLPDWFNWQAVIAILLFVAVVLLAVMVVHFIKGRK